MTNSDLHHQGLSAADSRWLVREVQRVLTELGGTAEFGDDGVFRLPDGRVVGLDNMARGLRSLPRKSWGRALRDQLEALMVTVADEAVEPVDVRAKLMPREQAEGFVEYDVLEPLPGIVAVLAAQGDRVSRMFGTLDQVGDRVDAYDTALANLAALPAPRHTRRRIEPSIADSWVEFLDAPDAWSAARVLVLPHLLRRMGINFPAHGVLVAVPTKHDLWVHIPVGESVVETALFLARQCYITWAEEPYPISPDVFLVSPDMLARRLVVGDQTGADIDAAVLVDLVEALGGPDHGRRASCA